MKQQLVSNHILSKSPHSHKRFCKKCESRLVPLHGAFKNLCPECNKSKKNIFDLNPKFLATIALIEGEYSEQIFKARIQTKKYDREQLIKNIRDRLVIEWHKAGLFTYSELEIIFGIKTKRLHELGKKDYQGLLTKNCEICGHVMEFGNNVYLYKQRRYCSPKCKSLSRRKEFRYLDRVHRKKEKKEAKVFISGESETQKAWEELASNL